MVTSDVFGNATTTETDVVDRPIKNAQKSGALVFNQADPPNEETQVNPGNSSVVRGGLEPPTHGFSVRCSTN